MSDLLDDFELWLQSRMEQVNTLIPGKVQSYSASTRLAVVKPSVKSRTMHADVFDIPPIADVPVIWPSCGDFTLEGTLKQGDGVLLLFAQSGIGNWQQGTTDAAAEDQTRFSLQDAIAIPGLWQPRNVPKHKGRTAAWGLRSESVSIGGTKGGKVVVENGTQDLRDVLESLQTILPAMDAQLLALNALLPGYVTQATAITAALTKIKGLLA
jgi:hypothetical protein